MQDGRGIEKVRDLLQRVQAGIEPGKVFVAMDDAGGTGATAATGSVACTQANITAGDTFILCGVTFTATTGPSSEPSLGQFAFLTSNTVTGAALAAAINANPALAGILTAASAAGTVTWTLADKGLHGQLAKGTGSTGMVVTNPTNGAAATTLSSGLRVFRKGA